MSKRWSKLQSRLYEMNSNDGYHGSKLPRYFITVDKKIIFDYPKNFDTTKKYGVNSYPWDTDISAISSVIEEYIQCPKSELLNNFLNDKWGITDILHVCDRRIGKRRLQELKTTITNEILIEIINRRIYDKRT